LRHRDDGSGVVNYFAATVESIGTIRENKGMAGNIAKSLSIEVSIEIDAPRAKVWATVSDFHDMSWFPGVVKTTGTGGNEPDVAKRQLVLDGGATIDESLYKYDAADMSYASSAVEIFSIALRLNMSMDIGLTKKSHANRTALFDPREKGSYRKARSRSLGTDRAIVKRGMRFLDREYRR
jgi:Polyketide cyclase / dehydrase and lipid transport